MFSHAGALDCVRSGTYWDSPFDPVSFSSLSRKLFFPVSLSASSFKYWWESSYASFLSRQLYNWSTKQLIEFELVAMPILCRDHGINLPECFLTMMCTAVPGTIPSVYHTRYSTQNRVRWLLLQLYCTYCTVVLCTVVAASYSRESEREGLRIRVSLKVMRTEARSWKYSTGVEQQLYRNLQTTYNTKRQFHFMKSNLIAFSSHLYYEVTWQVNVFHSAWKGKLWSALWRKLSYLVPIRDLE